MVLGLLLSSNAYAEELLLKCKYLTKWDEEGKTSVEHYGTIYQKLNLSKKFWINAAYKGKIGKSDYLIATDDYFFKYSLDYTYMLHKTPSDPYIIFQEISRFDGKWTEYKIDIKEAEDKKLKRKIDSTRNDEKKALLVRDLVKNKIFATLYKFPKDWWQVEASCSKAKKAF